MIPNGLFIQSSPIPGILEMKLIKQRRTERTCVWFCKRRESKNGIKMGFRPALKDIFDKNQDNW